MIFTFIYILFYRLLNMYNHIYVINEQFKKKAKNVLRRVLATDGRRIGIYIIMNLHFEILY